MGTAPRPKSGQHMHHLHSFQTIELVLPNPQPLTHELSTISLTQHNERKSSFLQNTIHWRSGGFSQILTLLYYAYILTCSCSLLSTTFFQVGILQSRSKWWTYTVYPHFHLSQATQLVSLEFK